MSEIERVELIKGLLERLGVLYNACCMDEDFDRCDGACAKCVKAIEGIKEALQGIVIGKIEQTVERPLFFSKRLAISRMFNSWFNKNPEHSRYGIDMLLISYLDKKGWLNTQKIMDQLTDSRIKAVLGEEVGERLINDDKSKDNIGIIKKRLDKIRKKYHIGDKENSDEV